MSTAALDSLDRTRTMIFLSASPLEEHGPHLPLGVDAFVARHFAQRVAERVVAARPEWTAVLTPTLYVGSFTFKAPGTVTTRQRLVRDLLVDYGDALAHAGFRYILIANGHGGPGHLAALDEAAARVSRRRSIVMASFTGDLAWRFLRGQYLDKIETALGRRLSKVERRAFAEDAHAGWWETSMMLMLRPDLVDGSYRALPPARYSLAARARPNYPLKRGGRGYVGHPALADPAFARATTEVLLNEATTIVEALLDGRLTPADRRSPFFAIPFFRTNFWPIVAAASAAVAVTAWLRPRHSGRER